MTEELTVIRKGQGSKFYFQVLNDKSKKGKVEKVTSNEVTIAVTCTCKHGSLFGVNSNKPCKHIRAALKNLIQ